MKEENVIGIKIVLGMLSLTSAFSYVKLEYARDISWWFVFSPIWIPMLIVFFLVIIASFMFANDEYNRQKQEEEYEKELAYRMELETPRRKRK